MKLLLDECLPTRLRLLLTGHEAFTVTFMRWKGIKNGRLLALAAADGFDALITTDAGIPHQHNPNTLPISLVVLRTKSNSYDDITPLIPALLAALSTLPPRSIIWLP